MTVLIGPASLAYLAAIPLSVQGGFATIYAPRAFVLPSLRALLPPKDPYGIPLTPFTYRMKSFSQHILASRFLSEYLSNARGTIGILVYKYLASFTGSLNDNTA